MKKILSNNKVMKKIKMQIWRMESLRICLIVMIGEL